MLGANDRDVLTIDVKLTISGFRRRQQARSFKHVFLHPQTWRVLHVPKPQLQQGINTFGVYPDKVGGLSTDPLKFQGRPTSGG